MVDGLNKACVDVQGVAANGIGAHQHGLSVVCLGEVTQLGRQVQLACPFAGEECIAGFEFDDRHTRAGNFRAEDFRYLASKCGGLLQVVNIDQRRGQHGAVGTDAADVLQQDLGSGLQLGEQVHRYVPIVIDRRARGAATDTDQKQGGQQKCQRCAY